MAKKTLLTLALAGMMGVFGCGRLERSEVLHTDGVVTDMTHIQGHHEESISPVIIPLGDGGLAMSPEGDIGFNGSIATHSKYVTSGYKVKIQSENKIFHLNNTKEAARAYYKLKQGQKVDVSYREVYRAFYKDTNNDGKKDLVRRKLIKIEFLDANPKKELGK